MEHLLVSQIIDLFFKTKNRRKLSGRSHVQDEEEKVQKYDRNNEEDEGQEGNTYIYESTLDFHNDIGGNDSETDS